MASCIVLTNTPVGALQVVEDGDAITQISFFPSAIPSTGAPTPLLLDAIAQLNEYFAGTRQNFSLPLAPQGTLFQQKVWSALCRIPYGETKTYRQIASELENPNAARAVGSANHRNPIAIVIPCHRVIGANGTLTGYAGGIDKKENLLQLEQKYRKNTG